MKRAGWEISAGAISSRTTTTRMPMLVKLIEALSKLFGHANAAVGGGITGQHPAMECDSGPGDAFHEGHVAVFIDIRLMELLLLHDAGRFPRW